MKGKIIAIVIAAAIVLIGAYLFYQSTPVVSAEGQSSIKVDPDEISLYLTIETRNKSAQIAQEQNTEVSNRLVNALKINDIVKEDIQLSNYNVYQEYDWINNRRVEKGYVARREVVVKLKDFSKTGEVIDAAAQSGTLINYINFELSSEKQNEYKAMALEQASADARNKASSIAAGQGKKLGKLVSLNNNEFNYGGPYLAYSTADSTKGAEESFAAARDAVVGVSPKELEVGAFVSAQYRLSWF